MFLHGCNTRVCPVRVMSMLGGGEILGSGQYTGFIGHPHRGLPSLFFGRGEEGVG